MKRYFVTFGLAIAAVLLLLAACGGSDPTATPVPPAPTATPVPPASTATPVSPASTATLVDVAAESGVARDADLLFALGEMNQSGQKGWAALIAKGDQTLVVVNLNPFWLPFYPPLDTELVHIHGDRRDGSRGSCRNQALGAVVYPLTSFVGGAGLSLSTVDVPLADLRSGRFAIDSHQQGNPKTYTTCGHIPVEADALTIDLDEQNESGRSGKATLTARGDRTEVVLSISPGALETEAVHIHGDQRDGSPESCGNETPGSVVYPLTSFVDGFSVSTVDVSLTDLRTGSFAINSHQKGNPSLYAVCGHIPAEPESGTGPAPIKVKGSIVNFTLPNLTVPVGTTVVWTNEDVVQHTTTSGTDGQFDGLGWNSLFLSKGETFSHTFNQEGTFSYTCRLHPSLSGTVTVVASGEPVVGSGSPGSGDVGY